MSKKDVACGGYPPFVRVSPCFFFLVSSLPCPRCLRVAGVFLAVLVVARFSSLAGSPRGLPLLASLTPELSMKGEYHG